MKRTPELQRMIDNRETELQRYYDAALEEKALVERVLASIPKQIERLEDELLTLNAEIAKCRRRAEELGALDVL